MLLRLLLVLPLVTSNLAIKVAVVKDETAPEVPTTLATKQSEGTESEPIYYTSDNVNLDSYLLPADPNKPQQVISAETPATFLLPPNEQTQEGYVFAPPQTAQSDWYPMAHVLSEFQPGDNLPPIQDGGLIPMLPYNPSYAPQPIQLPQNIRVGKGLERSQITVPSTKLEPPLETAQDHFLITVPSKELELPKQESEQQFNYDELRGQELPVLKINKKFKPSSDRDEPISFKLNPAQPTLSVSLLPPKPEITNSKVPTKLYPKKYGQGFKPIPIPIGQYAEGSVKPYKQSLDTENLTPSDEKKIYLYEQAEKKKRLKESEENSNEEVEDDESDFDEEISAPQEQEASESYSHSGRNVYPAPLKVARPVVPLSGSGPPPAGDRTEFRMHGIKGPHSYQFGYDTGKGKNRQFRYEERDNDGHVRGHYGYVDRHGKMRVVNYDADPKLGFRAEAEPENKDTEEP